MASGNIEAPPTAVTTARSSASAVSVSEARTIAVETYVWGYPLVLTDITRRVQTNVERPSGAGRAPINQFSHAATFPPATFRDIVRPSFDTLYSNAWLDVSDEPMVLTLPATKRYHVFQMMDAWTEVFAAPGIRMTGGKGGDYLVAGPGWLGDVPQGIELLRSPTDHVWILGRIQTNGAPDYDFVHQLQVQVALVPLSRFGKAYAPPKGKVDPSVDINTPPMITVNNMGAERFFRTLLESLKKNPPHVHDQGVVTRMKRIGLNPGMRFDFARLPALVRDALDEAAAVALKTLERRHAATAGTLRNGWSITTGAIGYYGGDYAYRALIALCGIGANRPEDAIYPSAITDNEGRPLEGAHRYVMRFEKGQTPPVDAFWSLTLYDAQGFPVENPIGRHAIGDRDRLRVGDDGSLTLYIQHASPGSVNESNWLPAPEGAFTLTMRCYSPRYEIAIGEWVPPPVKRVDRLEAK
jgi:hypothetical protein